MAIPSAVCPGGEEAVLKIVGPKGLARSNRVHGVGCVKKMINTATILSSNLQKVREF